ncbi:MAG TPA: outer membrane beta-barrel protein [Azospirillaceae bacterium]|nr:outer membrane beta-barrel protein [Azospirillaceae bacterium]
MSPWLTTFTLTGLLALAVPVVTQAQGLSETRADPRRQRSGANVTQEVAPGERTSTKPDSERLHDSYQPKGVDLGSFLMLPKFEVDEVYNSNLFATETDAKGDFVTVARPEVRLRSRFKEHALNIGALVEHYRHQRHESDNRTDGQVEVDGRYDLTAETAANYFGQIFARHEDRGSPDDARGLKPTPIQGFANRVGLKHQFGRYTVLSEVGLDRREFDAVTTSLGNRISNADRDRWELQARLRGSYEMFPGYAAVVETSGNSRRYDQDRDRNGFERNSNGYRVETGIGVDLSQLVRGDFLVGYFGQRYNDPRFTDPQGVSVRATFNWTPTALTIIVPSLERSINETTTLGASAMVRNSFNITVRHELERNIVLSAYGNVAYDQMSGVNDRNAWTYEGKAKAIYAFTPEIYVGAEAGYRDKQADAAGESFQQTTLMARLGLQY